MMMMMMMASVTSWRRQQHQQRKKQHSHRLPRFTSREKRCSSMAVQYSSFRAQIGNYSHRNEYRKACQFPMDLSAKKKCRIVESREDALSRQLTPTYHLLASTCWFEGVQSLVASPHVYNNIWTLCVYIFIWCVCVHVHVVYVYIYDMICIPPLMMISIPLVTIESWDSQRKPLELGIPKSPEDLCHFASAAFMGLRFRCFF